MRAADICAYRALGGVGSGWVGFSGSGSTSLPDPAYRLELVLERDTMAALQTILSNGPLKDMDNFYYPLRGCFATFSIKLKALQKSDAPDIVIGDPFSFLLDGREMAKGRKVLLKNYPVDELSENDMLAVEANILSYMISLPKVTLSDAWDIPCHCIACISLVKVTCKPRPRP